MLPYVWMFECVYFNGHCSVLITTLIFHRFYFFFIELHSLSLILATMHTRWCLQEKRCTFVLVQPTNIQALRTRKTKSQSWKVTHAPTQQNNNNRIKVKKKMETKGSTNYFITSFFYHLFYISGLCAMCISRRLVLISTS